MQYLDAVSKMAEWSLFISKANHSISWQSKSIPDHAEEAEVEWFYEDLQDLLELAHKKDVLFIIGDWNAKAWINTWSNRLISPWSTEWAGQRLTELCQVNTLVIANTLFQKQKRYSTYGHHQMVNTEIRLIIYHVGKYREGLYRQQKQDWQMNVPQIMNALLPNSDLNWKK